MTETHSDKRHPFLDDLSDNVSLTSTVMNDTVVGKDAVLRAVKTTAKLYLSQNITYLKRIDEGRSLMVYDSDLTDGKAVHGIVVIDWNLDGTVSHLDISFSPLGPALAMAKALGNLD